MHRSATPLLLVLGTLTSVAAGAQSSQPAPQRSGGPPVIEANVAGLPPPEGLSSDPLIWPNRESCRNSDAWIVEQHDQIKQMRPRVLVLNFANDASMEDVRGHAGGLCKAFAEATRYHGYVDPSAKPFIDFQIAKLIDLRDPPPAEGKPERKTSTKMPRKTNPGPAEPLIDYAALFRDEFAPQLGFADPRTPGRFLNLAELVNEGYVHELWFYAIHEPGDRWPGNETCEMKQFYDAECKPIAGKHGHAGNGRDRSLPWVGRSFRVCFFNPHRGPGCSMENYGHTMEWIANSRSNLYYHKYFYEFAEFNLDRKYGLPFDKFYEHSYDKDAGDKIEFPAPTKLAGVWHGKPFEVDPYVAVGGSAHFPPGARHHYDLASPFTVMATIENYRLRKKPGEADKAEPFNHEKFERYKETAPDCMGRWIVYWFQSMPGYGNECIDEEGKPMKNWWPFLFY